MRAISSKSPICAATRKIDRKVEMAKGKRGRHTLPWFCTRPASRVNKEREASLRLPFSHFHSPPHTTRTNQPTPSENCNETATRNRQGRISPKRLGGSHKQLKHTPGLGAVHPMMDRWLIKSKSSLSIPVSREIAVSAHKLALGGRAKNRDCRFRRRQFPLRRTDGQTDKRISLLRNLPPSFCSARFTLLLRSSSSEAIEISCLTDHLPALPTKPVRNQNTLGPVCEGLCSE